MICNKPACSPAVSVEGSAAASITVPCVVMAGTVAGPASEIAPAVDRRLTVPVLVVPKSEPVRAPV
jgi:hypothetical protein